jgi:CRISPR/Cas system-associated exonuclease Cas4 (RecB family)
MDYPILSVSKIKCWKSCRQKYYYKYVDKLRPKRQAKPFYLGTIVHESLEKYLANEPVKPVIDKYITEFQSMDGLTQEFYGFDFPEMITGLIEGYKAYWEPQDQKLIVHDIELDFGYDEPCEILPNLFLRGRIDAVIENENGYWIMEHKTCKKIPDDDFRFTDIQTSLYQLVLNKLGYPKINGSCYDYIRKKLPAIPEVLKSGYLSKRKNIDTTYEVYLKAIKDNNENVDDYSDILDILKNKINPFYKRAWVVKPEKLMASLAYDAQNVAEDIANNANKPFKAFGMECRSCDYRALCEAELMNYDIEFLLRNQFTCTAEDNEVIEVEESEENTEQGDNE